jgi:flagellar hook-basal body complex protein FliE
LLKSAINQVNDLESGSQNELQKFLNNDSDLHSVMIALEKADISFQMMMQVRNKIVSAYQEIMKTQV